MNLYDRPSGVQTRWASFENPAAERGKGGTANRGAKGCPSRPLPAGETATLLDFTGAGIVTRIWMTIADRSPAMLRGIVVRMFWDGCERPAVCCPLGDFFGVGLGRRVPFECALFSDPEGRSFNCLVPMPFRTGARITLTNETARDLAMLFHDVDFLLTSAPDPRALYFHATWRRENPNRLGADFTILPEVHGTGRFLGCNVGVITNPAYAGSWWGEGEVKIRLDGDGEHPTLCGTGTEDYIGTAWGMNRFAHRTQGCLVADPERRQWAFYRYHVDDPVFFASACHVALQTIGGSTRAQAAALLRAKAPLIPVTFAPAGRAPLLLRDPATATVDLLAPDCPDGWVNFFRQDDWSCTACFYLDRPDNELPDLAPFAERVRGLEETGGATARADEQQPAPRTPPTA